MLSIFPKHYFDLVDLNSISELRLRKDCNLVYSILSSYFQSDYIVKKEDIDYIINKATKLSLYAHQDTIKKGYIAYKGIRIGLAGEGVYSNENIQTIKNISSLTIRLPKDIEFSDQRLVKLIDNFDNTLIISKPGLGKTTLLRYLTKKLSSKLFNIMLIDEKGEISYDNSLTLYCDVILNIEKKIAYKDYIKVLRPDIVCTDEIFGASEIDMIKDTIRCGVKVLATLHSANLDTINQAIYADLISQMRYIILIDKIGVISKIIDTKK